MKIVISKNNDHDRYDTASNVARKATAFLLLLFFALVLHFEGLKISKSKMYHVCPEWLRWRLGNCERVGKETCIERCIATEIRRVRVRVKY